MKDDNDRLRLANSTHKDELVGVRQDLQAAKEHAQILGLEVEGLRAEIEELRCFHDRGAKRLGQTLFDEVGHVTTESDTFTVPTGAYATPWELTPAHDLESDQLPSEEVMYRSWPPSNL